MLSFFSSLLNIESDKSKSSGSSTKSDIINILKKRNLSYLSVTNGIKVDITNTDNENDIYTLTIPLNFKDTHYVHIKKNLKNKDGDCINCIYLYKITETELKFINRIKIIDLETIKCDEDNTRISTKIIKIIEDLLNEIIVSKGALTSSTTNVHQVGTLGGNNDSITNSDVRDFRYLKYKSKYNNLKNIMNTSLTESSDSSNDSEDYRSTTEGN
jgi:hypothetical protein